MACSISRHPFTLWIFLWLPLAEASHFRHGMIIWAPADSNSNTIRFTYRLAFRRSYSGHFCDQSTILQGTLIGQGSWTAMCYNASNPQCSSSTTVASGHHICADLSTIEDWSMAENSFNYTFPSAGEKWSVSYSSCCWISSLSRYGGGSWLVSTSLNLTRRSDNGRINSSPIARSAAIVRFQEGCPQAIRIPVEDPDGDVVKCRHSTYSESGFNSGSFPYGVLDEKSCVLKYDGGSNTAGTYAVALTLENFPAGTTNFANVKPFSTVGLQFLVIVSSHSGACNDTPVFTGSTPQDGECSEVHVGSAYTAVIQASVSDVSKQIVKLIMITSYPEEVQLTYLRNRGGFYQDNVTWYPSQQQIGKQMFCFKVVDSAGLESEKRCVTILVGLSNIPRVLIATRSPRNPVSTGGPDCLQLSIKFDRVIKRPLTSFYIRLVLLPSGQTIYKVDTSSQSAAIDTSGTMLYFVMHKAAFSMSGSYAILIDKGAVVGQGCSYDGPPTPGIESLSDWQFVIKDINECDAPSSSRITPTRASSYLSGCVDGQIGRNPGNGKQTALIGGVAAVGVFGLVVVIAQAVVCVKLRLSQRFLQGREPIDLHANQNHQMGKAKRKMRTNL